ncbi:hypothetical protein IPJ72_07025 [Candidatus Peregrinibacteria bacterium]|nr:MAG: hypothetical protein IPJ72_07025 [Candidatus Peregrinibacteria bacterium]
MIGLLILTLITSQWAGVPLPFFAVDTAHAQALNSIPAANQLGIIAVLVEDSLLSDGTEYSTSMGRATLKEHIFAYAQNAQNRIANSRAVVLSVSPNESTQKIASVLEKMYYEGIDLNLLNERRLDPDTPNQLVGVVLVGRLPVPVVTDSEGNTFPSVYPYTDFYRKRYLYDHVSERFLENTAAIDPVPEIWQGVIRSPSADDAARRQELAAYFDKNNQYSQGLNGYDQFDQRILHLDLPAMEAQMNPVEYRHYLRASRWLEEIMFQRFNKYLLRDIIQEIAAENEPDKLPAERTPLMDDATLAGLSDTTAEFSIRKYVRTFAGTLQTYLGRLNEVVVNSGRWDASELDSVASLITVRDEFVKTYLLGKTVELEKRVQAALEPVADPLEVPERVQVRVRQCQDSTCQQVDEERVFELNSYVAGKRVSQMSSAQECAFVVGQERPDGVSVQTNNSGWARLNAVYNPTRLVELDSQHPVLSEHPDYVRAGGCVGNNAVTVQTSQLNLGPHLCDPSAAYTSVVDPAGAKEVRPRPNSSGLPAPVDALGVYAASCRLDDLSFLPNPEQLLRDDEGVYNEVAYSRGLTIPGSPINPFGSRIRFREVIHSLYRSMRGQGEIAVDADRPFGEPTLAYDQLNFIIRSLLQSPTGAARSYVDRGDVIELSVVPVNRALRSVVEHVEPTDETLKAVKASLATSTLPADGIRFIEFNRAGQTQRFRHVNLFRLEGESASDMSTQAQAMITEKDQELNQLLGNNRDVISQFFLENPGLIDAMVWRQMVWIRR